MKKRREYGHRDNIITVPAGRLSTNLITDTVLNLFDILKKSSVHLGGSVDIEVADVLSHHGTKVVDSKPISNFRRDQSQKQGLKLWFRLIHRDKSHLKHATDPDRNTDADKLEGNSIHFVNHDIDFLIEKVWFTHFG